MVKQLLKITPNKIFYVYKGKRLMGHAPTLKQAVKYADIVASRTRLGKTEFVKVYRPYYVVG